MATFTGMSFPFRQGTTSFPETATDAELIRQSIMQILLTQKGERVMRPDFGSSVMRYIFENNTALLTQQVRMEVFSSISRWEPRVLVQNVEVERNDVEVTITIYFVLAATRQQDKVSLAIPAM